MSITITAFTDKYKTPQQVMEEGMQAEVLRNNPAFKLAIDDMYTNICIEGDKSLAGALNDSREQNAALKHYALLRVLLTDFILTLDGTIQAGENANYSIEQQE